VNAKITGDDIREWRIRKALTQAIAAKRLGVAENTLKDWERGKRAIGVTRGITEDQFRRVVRTIFHT
jgi:DNA-binding XRE family transcriptional regulator